MRGSHIWLKSNCFFEIGLGIKYILLLSLRGGKKRLNHVLGQPRIMSSLKGWGQCSEAHSRCSIKNGWWTAWYLLLPPCPSSQLPPFLQSPRSLLYPPGNLLSKVPSSKTLSLIFPWHLGHVILFFFSCDTFNTEISKPQGTVGMGEHTIRSWSRYVKRASPMGSRYLTFRWGCFSFWGSHSDAAVLTSESLKQSLRCHVFQSRDILMRCLDKTLSQFFLFNSLYY